MFRIAPTCQKHEQKTGSKHTEKMTPRMDGSTKLMSNCSNSLVVIDHRVHREQKSIFNQVLFNEETILLHNNVCGGEVILQPH